jgi:hypothetical protein
MSKIAKHQRKFWLSKLKLNSWITVIGGIIIFTSWIVEKKFQSKWTDEKDNLKRSQLVIDITENQRSIYEVAYLNECQRQQKDTLLLASYQQRLARVYMDLLSWSKGRVSDDAKKYNEIISSKRQIDEQNRNCLKESDYKTINRNFNKVAAVFGEVYMKLDNDFSDKVDIVNDNEKFWTLVFTTLYILGSMLLGISYVAEQLKKTE